MGRGLLCLFVVVFVGWRIEHMLTDSERVCCGLWVPCCCWSRYKWTSGFGAKVTKQKVRGVVGCGLCFWQRGSKLYPKTIQRISFWHNFHPFLHQLGAKGDLKINKNNKKLKTCKPKYKQNEKS
jgi:hypothetical protein